MNSRLPAENRLVGSIEFRSVFGHHLKYRDRNWIILFRGNDRLIARLGMAITKKNVRKAVQRNRLRRIIREAFRIRKDLLTGLDIVVLVSYSINTLTRKEQATTLGNLFDKLILQRKTGVREIPHKCDE